MCNALAISLVAEPLLDEVENLAFARRQGLEALGDGTGRCELGDVSQQRPAEALGAAKLSAVSALHGVDELDRRSFARHETSDSGGETLTALRVPGGDRQRDDHAGPRTARQRRQCFERSRHRQIEQHDVRGKITSQTHRLVGITGSRDDIHALDFAQDERQPLSGRDEWPWRRRLSFH